MAISRVFTLSGALDNAKAGNRGGVSGAAYISSSNGSTNITLRFRGNAPSSPMAAYLLCGSNQKNGHIRIVRTLLDAAHNGSCAAENVMGIVVVRVLDNKEELLCRGASGISPKEMNLAMTQIRLFMTEKQNTNAVNTTKQRSDPINAHRNAAPRALVKDAQPELTPDKKSPPAPRVLRAGEAYSERKSKAPQHQQEQTTVAEVKQAPYQNRSVVIGNILEQATKLFGGLPGSFAGASPASMTQKEVIPITDTPIADTEHEAAPNPFPRSFPNSYWKRKRNHNQLFGRANIDGVFYTIVAVEGKKSSRPPRYLRGFNRFLRSREGKGYWLSIRKEN